MWIEERGNGKYKFIERYVDPYTEQTKKVSIFLTSKSNQAKKQAAIELQGKIQKLINSSKQSSLTFLEATKEFDCYYENKVKRSSYLSYKSTEKTVIKAIGEDVLIRNIDAPYLKKKIEHLYYVEKYSFNYVKKVKSIIISIIDYQKEKGYSTNDVKFKLKLTKRIERVEDKYLEKEELRAIINQLNSYAKNIRKADMVEFMALTGLRYGELIALREEDLYEGYIKINGTIDFRDGKYDEVIRSTPKTRASFRNVTLNDRAIEILFKILQENMILKEFDGYKDLGYIFTNKFGRPIDYRTFEPALKNAAKKSNISKNVTTHYLRHTHISILAELNIPIKAVMDRVGHEDSKTTLKIYTHVTNKMRSSLIDKLNEFTY